MICSGKRISTTCIKMPYRAIDTLHYIFLHTCHIKHLESQVKHVYHTCRYLKQGNHQTQGRNNSPRAVFSLTNWPLFHGENMFGDNVKHSNMSHNDVSKTFQRILSCCLTLVAKKSISGAGSSTYDSKFSTWHIPCKHLGMTNLQMRTNHRHWIQISIQKSKPPIC